MGIATLIIGESGSGKSTSIRNLNPDETYIINVIDKPLPFKNQNKYKKSHVENGEKVVGNNYLSDDYRAICQCVSYVNKDRPEIKNIVIDDFQYIMANEFMRRATEKGFDKFSEMADHALKVINATNCSRGDLNFFILCHSHTADDGKSKAKTIGKLLDDKITIEGLFTIVLHALIIEGKYWFLTQNDGFHVAKSPIDMFDQKYIENDLQNVKTKIENYYKEEDIPQ